MENQPQSMGVNVKVVGLGSAGARVVDSLAALGFPASRFLAVDTDSEKLQQCQLAEKLQLGKSTRRGWGCSGDASTGAACLRAAKETLAGKLVDTDLLLLVTGLAGGLGGGGAPVAAGIAADAGALVIAVGIEPFDLESLDDEIILIDVFFLMNKPIQNSAFFYQYFDGLDKILDKRNKRYKRRLARKIS